MTSPPKELFLCRVQVQHMQKAVQLQEEGLKAALNELIYCSPQRLTYCVCMCLCVGDVFIDSTRGVDKRRVSD